MNEENQVIQGKHRNRVNEKQKNNQNPNNKEEKKIRINLK